MDDLVFDGMCRVVSFKRSSDVYVVISLFI